MKQNQLRDAGDETKSKGVHEGSAWVRRALVKGELNPLAKLPLHERGATLAKRSGHATCTAGMPKLIVSEVIDALLTNLNVVCLDFVQVRTQSHPQKRCCPQRVQRQKLQHETRFRRGDVMRQAPCTGTCKGSKPDKE